jgi:hypothetical protein
MGDVRAGGAEDIRRRRDKGGDAGLGLFEEGAGDPDVRRRGPSFRIGVPGDLVEVIAQGAQLVREGMESGFQVFGDQIAFVEIGQRRLAEKGGRFSSGGTGRLLQEAVVGLGESDGNGRMRLAVDILHVFPHISVAALPLAGGDPFREAVIAGTNEGDDVIHTGRKEKSPDAALLRGIQRGVPFGKMASRFAAV